jgi:uncharacterized integral membrane protein (TIGR00697 family)
VAIAQAKSREQTERIHFSPIFLVLAALFITSLLVSNIIASRLVSVFGRVLPAAIVVFPISYIVGDVLTEVYGYSRARRIIWLGFGCNLFAVAAIWLGGALPAAPFWQADDAYSAILGSTPRLLLASFVAYLFGEFANAFVLSKMKLVTNGRWLWTRTIGSTLVGQGIDSLLFIFIAFGGVLPAAVIASTVLNQWIAKTLYEGAATPVTYAVVGAIKRREKIDTYDYSINFNPLALGEG